jgi:hypothetical protein
MPASLLKDAWPRFTRKFSPTGPVSGTTPPVYGVSARVDVARAPSKFVVVLAGCSAVNYRVRQIIDSFVGKVRADFRPAAFYRLCEERMSHNERRRPSYPD